MRFKSFNESYNFFTGDEVAQYIEEITPEDSDVPDYFINTYVRPNDGWKIRDINLKTLLKTDRDFRDYHRSGEERYDEDEVDRDDLYNELVVYKGKLLDGYSRASKLLNLGEFIASAYILK